MASNTPNPQGSVPEYSNGMKPVLQDKLADALAVEYGIANRVIEIVGAYNYKSPSKSGPPNPVTEAERQEILNELFRLQHMYRDVEIYYRNMLKSGRHTEGNAVPAESTSQSGVLKEKALTAFEDSVKGATLQATPGYRSRLQIWQDVSLKGQIKAHESGTSTWLWEACSFSGEKVGHLPAWMADWNDPKNWEPYVVLKSQSPAGSTKVGEAPYPTGVAPPPKGKGTGTGVVTKRKTGKPYPRGLNWTQPGGTGSGKNASFSASTWQSFKQPAKLPSTQPTGQPARPPTGHGAASIARIHPPQRPAIPPPGSQGRRPVTTTAPHRPGSSNSLPPQGRSRQAAVTARSGQTPANPRQAAVTARSGQTPPKFADRRTTLAPGPSGSAPFSNSIGKNPTSNGARRTLVQSFKPEPLSENQAKIVVRANLKRLADFKPPTPTSAASASSSNLGTPARQSQNPLRMQGLTRPLIRAY